MITKFQIEQFYNRDREPDVKYTFFDKIPVTLQKLIKEILIYKLKKK